MAQVIITKNGTGSATPSSLVQGELGLNVSTGQLFYGTSGSSNAVSSSFVFTNVTASNISASGTIVANKIEADSLVSHANDANTGLEFASDTVNIEGNNVTIATFASNRVELNKRTEIDANLTCSANISASTLDIATNIKVNNMPAGVDNSVVILDSDNVLKTDEVQAAIFNTSDAIITAATANETLSGTELGDVTVGAATVADQAKTTRTTTNAGFFPVMVDSANASATAENLVTPTAGFEFNPSSKTATIGFVSATHITASQNISASGGIYANDYYSKGQAVINYSTANNRISIGNKPTLIQGNVTASGDISASGDIEALTFTSPSLDVTDGSVQMTAGIPLTFGGLVGADLGRLNIEHDDSNGTIANNAGLLTISNTGGSGIQLGGAANQHVTASGNINTTGIYQIEGVNAIDYVSSTHLFGSNTSFTKLRSTKGIEMTAPVTASGPVSSSGGFIGEQHILRCLPFYLNDVPLTTNALYFGSTAGHQVSNWNDPQPIGGDPNTVTSFDLSDDDQNWGMFLPFDVSRIEIHAAARPGLGTGENLTAALYTASRIEGNETTITLGFATASQTTFDGGGKYTNIDIDYRPDTVIPKGTMLYFGVGTNTTSATAKNARGYHTILVTKASVS